MRRLATVALVAAAVGVLLGAAAIATVSGPTAEEPTDPTDTDPPTPPTGEAGLEQFDSAVAFEEYVHASRSAPRGGIGRPRVRAAPVEEQADAARAGGDDAGGSGGGDAGRVSSTNVQVRGIDEPDVLKTDGQERVAYYTSRRALRRGGVQAGGGTRVIDVEDPADPAVVGEIDERGRMLLTGDRLVVLSDGAVRGYDVSDPAAPERSWERSVNGTVSAARLLDGQVYLVVRSRPAVVDCPIEPLADGPAVACDEVYHPTRQVSTPTTYTVVSLSPVDGTVEGTESVVGSRGRAVTYVSEDAVYLSYTQRHSRAELLVEFALDGERLDAQARERLREVRSYDLSPAAYRAEVRATLQAYTARVDDETGAIEEAFQSYLSERRREVVTTGVVRVGIGDGPTVEAHGEVPGHPLNQFSMDARDGRLRVATTVPSVGDEPSVNDVYTLDEDLERVGAAQGMGEGQRVYAARFVEDTAYLVTFRQVDPFHVVDLSDPADPEELGAVELPGFSRYLHPLGDERVLGIGQEDGQAKAVVFDASEPSDPTVVDSEVLADRWSAVRQSHHAFLQDERHEVAFVPGSRGGYVFDYDTAADGEAALELQTRVEVRDRAVRAAYVDDYLYVFGTGEVAVVDERDWDRVATLSLTDPEDG